MKQQFWYYILLIMSISFIAIPVQAQTTEERKEPPSPVFVSPTEGQIVDFISDVFFKWEYENKAKIKSQLIFVSFDDGVTYQDLRNGIGFVDFDGDRRTCNIKLDGPRLKAGNYRFKLMVEDKNGRSGETTVGIKLRPRIDTPYIGSNVVIITGSRFLSFIDGNEKPIVIINGETVDPSKVEAFNQLIIVHESIVQREQNTFIVRINGISSSEVGILKVGGLEKVK